MSNFLFLFEKSVDDALNTYGRHISFLCISVFLYLCNRMQGDTHRVCVCSIRRTYRIVCTNVCAEAAAVHVSPRSSDVIFGKFISRCCNIRSTVASWFNMSKCGPTSHSTYAFFQLLFFLCLLGSTWNAQPRHGTQRTEAKKNKTEMNKNETKRMKAKEHTQAYPQSVRAAAAISIVFMN